MTCWMGRPLSTSCIRALRALGEFLAPMGATKYSKWRLSVLKAKNFLSSGCIGNCQNPFRRSRDVKNWGLSSFWMESSIRGRGKTTLSHLSLILRKSVKNLHPPSFFLAKRIGAEKGLLEGWTSPSAIISNA